MVHSAEAANPYSFSLSTLFLVVTVIGGFLGLLVNYPALAMVVAAFAVPTIVIFFFRILKRRRAGEILSRADQASEIYDSFAILLLVICWVGILCLAVFSLGMMVIDIIGIFPSNFAR